MAFLNNIRNQPKEKRIRLIWIFCGIAVVILLVVWILSSQYRKDTAKDTTLFDSAGQGVNDLRQNYNKPIK